MESSCNYNPVKDAFIYNIVFVWPVQKVAEFFKNKAAKWDFEVNTENSGRKTALDLLVRRKIRSERDNEVIKLLLEFGANPLWKDGDGKTTLCRIMRHKKDTELIIRFLEKVDDINATLDTIGVNALYMAVDTRNVAVLLYIMRRKPNLDITSYRGVSPLHEAASAENPNISRILLENGADVNIRDEDGETPIFAALNRKISMEQIHILLKHGADLKARDNAGRTPLHVLCANEVGIDVNILIVLLHSGADPNAADSMGRTPMECFIRNDATNIYIKHALVVAEMLIGHGARVNVRNGHNQTLLHVASKSGPCTFIKYLIHKGADTNAVNGQGKTFLQLLKHQDPCWRKVLQMLVLKQFMGECDFGDNLQRSIHANVEFSKFVARARRELTLLSDRHTESICPSRFDLLISSEKRAIRLCENEGIKSAMSSMDFADFPIFGYRLEVKYDKSCRRARAAAAAEEFFFEISNGRLNKYAADVIIQFIPTEYLLNVEECYKDMLIRRVRK
ncbi:ankyrin-1-like [Coccinella septempunctata]|uniref:ankyrin-1-like n=1 Tax=Coccinella septempunctata TaxID=41139 RepID=UPI001D08BE95|nr:ankyrin-1-like [Coccinella septempunctata]